MQQVSESAASRRVTQPTDYLRIFLLAIILVAFARLIWQLGEKDIWWDESLSLQRAEYGLWAQIANHMVMDDGYSQELIIDQHPFLFFTLEGIFIRLGGSSEFVQRLVSAMAATLLAPLLWTFSRAMTRKEVFLPAAPYLTALFAALSPFFLWYGQEARPYALWTMLAVLATYLLFRATEKQDILWIWAVPYLVSLVLFLSTHFFSLFLLPVHALLLFLWLQNRSRLAALIVATMLLLAGALIGIAALWVIIFEQGGGSNFVSVPFDVLIPDLLNAFSLGLSVDIDRVWWLDLIFGAFILSGAAWSIRSRQVLAARGWLPLAMMTVSVIGLLVFMQVQPAYMTARHMSLIGGGFILLLGGGLALLWHWQRWVTTAIILLLVAGMGYSTVNYFVQETYDKGDYDRMGRYLDGRVMPGDLVLVKSSYSSRLFDYYGPAAEIEDAIAAGVNVGLHGTPMLNETLERSHEQLAEYRSRFRRIWLVTIGPHYSPDFPNAIEEWLQTNMYLLDERTYFSHSSLKTRIYLQEAPIQQGVPQEIQYDAPATFGEDVRLLGYDVGPYGTSQLALPVTLYWQAIEPMESRYKYILNLMERTEDGGATVVATTEREPYDGVIPTIYWDPGVTIIEFSEIAPPLPADMAGSDRYYLTLQLYDRETQEKLPLSDVQDLTVAEEGTALELPFELGPAQP